MFQIFGAFFTVLVVLLLVVFRKAIYASVKAMVRGADKIGTDLENSHHQVNTHDKNISDEVNTEIGRAHV
jgi:hypothetical protein